MRKLKPFMNGWYLMSGDKGTFTCGYTKNKKIADEWINKAAK
jgi:hypothetical protein